MGKKNLSPKELFSNKLWFRGPQFLSLPRNCWPDLHVGENFSNYNIDNSSINLADGESLILPSSCTQSNVNNVNNFNLVAKEELLEGKSICLICTFDKNFGVSSVIDIANYSSYMKLLRVTGWVIKFIEKLKSLKNSNYTHEPYITSSNINEAKVLWIRDVQKDILISFNYQNLQHQLGLYHAKL